MQHLLKIQCHPFFFRVLFEHVFAEFSHGLFFSQLSLRFALDDQYTPLSKPLISFLQPYEYAYLCFNFVSQ
jgi:hypothetical protein